MGDRSIVAVYPNTGNTVSITAQTDATAPQPKPDIQQPDRPATVKRYARCILSVPVPLSASTTPTVRLATQDLEASCQFDRPLCVNE